MSVDPDYKIKVRRVGKPRSTKRRRYRVDCPVCNVKLQRIRTWSHAMAWADEHVKGKIHKAGIKRIVFYYFSHD